MTAPADLQRGQTVRVLGYYRRRRVTFCLDRPPVVLDRGMIMLCGHSPRRGRYPAFVIRFVDADTPVEVIR